MSSHGKQAHSTNPKKNPTFFIAYAPARQNYPATLVLQVPKVDSIIYRLYRHLQDESGGILCADGRICNKVVRILIELDEVACFPVDELVGAGAYHVLVLRLPQGGARRTACGAADGSRSDIERIQVGAGRDTNSFEGDGRRGRVSGRRHAVHVDVEAAGAWIRVHRPPEIRMDRSGLDHAVHFSHARALPEGRGHERGLQGLPFELRVRSRLDELQGELMRCVRDGATQPSVRGSARDRSEERRVGKECR